MGNDDTYDLNYFFRDYVSEDIIAYCIGEVAMYHYKENLIGVRSVREKQSYFVDLASIKVLASHYAPTIDQVTEQHIKEAYDECDHTNEATERLPIRELVSKTAELLSREIAQMLDSKIMNMGKE